MKAIEKLYFPMKCQNTWTVFDSGMIATSKDEAKRLYEEKYKGASVVLEVFDPLPLTDEIIKKVGLLVAFDKFIEDEENAKAIHDVPLGNKYVTVEASYLDELKREAKAGVKLYEWMAGWFSEYPSGSAPVNTLRRYERQLKNDE